MWPFTATAEVETAPQTPFERYQEAQSKSAKARGELADATKNLARYHNTHQDLRLASLDGHRAICLNAMAMYPDLKRLEAAWREKHRQFTLANEEHRAAKKAAGLATY
jgi:uncharacterized protein (DUF3084 family)